MFTDSHCHLAMMGDRARELLVRARAAGVNGILVPGTDSSDGAKAVEIAQQHVDVWAAVGFHPHEASHCDQAAFQEIERLSSAPRIVAIGEIGLDYHYNFSPADIQREVLMRHFALANQRNLPVLIHNRESTADLMDLLDSDEGKRIRGVLHSFTESLEVAKKLLNRGFVISFSGIVTFKTAGNLRETARHLPHDAVLIETDTPYLAPVPHRGKENEPAFVIRVAELLGQLWGLSLEEVGRITTGTFERVFGVKVPR
jgi:TatD DNase family protein